MWPRRVGVPSFRVMSRQRNTSFGSRLAKQNLTQGSHYAPPNLVEQQNYTAQQDEQSDANTKRLEVIERNYIPGMPNTTLAEKISNVRL